MLIYRKLTTILPRTTIPITTLTAWNVICACSFVRFVNAIFNILPPSNGPIGIKLNKPTPKFRMIVHVSNP